MNNYGQSKSNTVESMHYVVNHTTEELDEKTQRASALSAPIS